MLQLRQSLKRKPFLRQLLLNSEQGAIDLASIMVGVIVIGLIGGVVSASVFTVIPWAQDNAAKQQLDSIASAQSAYMSLASSEALPSFLPVNSYGNSSHLQEANLLEKNDNYCTMSTGEDGKGYEAYVQSDSGITWMISDVFTTPKEVSPESIPTYCGHIAPLTDNDPTLTILTYRCDTTKTGIIPMNASLTGQETWESEEGKIVATYDNRSTASPRTLTSGVEYKVTFDGTYKSINSTLIPTGGVSIADCLRTVDHWGQETGVTNMQKAFWEAENLTSVPAQLPSTVTNITQMFHAAKNFNDPNISRWNISNVESMVATFSSAVNFNQPLDNWDTSNVTSMSGLFMAARAFNQPLNSWDISGVKSIESVFNNAEKFNQPLDKWDVSNVTNMNWTFNSASSFNQDISGWDVSSVTKMERMFAETYEFTGDLSQWDVSNVTNMRLMFENSKKFSSDISSWNVSKVTDMHKMLNKAAAFNHDLSGWNTASLENGTVFVLPSFPTEYMPAGTSK